MQPQKREFHVGHGHEHGRGGMATVDTLQLSQLQAQTFETDRALVQDMKFGQKSLFTPPLDSLDDSITPFPSNC